MEMTNYSIGLHVDNETEIDCKILDKVNAPILSMDEVTIFFNDDSLEKTIKALLKLRRKCKKAGVK